MPRPQSLLRSFLPKRPTNEEVAPFRLLRRGQRILAQIGPLLVSYYRDSNIFIPCCSSVKRLRGKKMAMKKILFLAVAVLSLVALPLLARPVAGDTNTGTPGQPNQSCQTVFPTGPLTPAGFNTAGFAVADTHYAGNGQTTQTPANSAAVSQYDVACFQAGQH